LSRSRRGFGALGLLVTGLSIGFSFLASGSPVASFTRSEPSPAVALEVWFDGTASQDPDGRILLYEWDFGDGTGGLGAIISHLYAADGSYVVRLTVANDRAATASWSGLIHVSGPAEVFPIGTGVGQAAPEFGLPDLNGTPVRITDFRGKVVLLSFWATWCPPCKETLPLLDALRARYEDQGVALVGVTTDLAAEPAIEFLKTNGYTHLVGLWGSLDSARAVQALYEVGGLPRVFVIDRIGVIRYSGRPENLTDADLEPWL